MRGRERERERCWKLEGSHPSSLVFCPSRSRDRTSRDISPSPPTRRYSYFPFSLLPPPFPPHIPFQLDSPLPPRSLTLSLSVSLTLSALRLFTLLIPQHPPRNNDVGSCFSCFPSLPLSLAFFLFGRLFPSAYLFLPLFHPLPRDFCPLLTLKRSNIPRIPRSDRDEDAACLRPNPRRDLPSRMRNLSVCIFFRMALGKYPDEERSDADLIILGFIEGGKIKFFAARY